MADDKIHAARLETYYAAIEQYNVATQAHRDCVVSIETRETYRGIFEGISHLFEMTATLPVDLLPTSETAVIYRDKLLRGIEELITIPVAEGLPPKLLDECPPMPVERPERPQR